MKIMTSFDMSPFVIYNDVANLCQSLSLFSSPELCAKILCWKIYFCKIIFNFFGFDRKMLIVLI